MCNLNILVQAKQQAIERVMALFGATTTLSFKTNPDGEGLWANGALIRSQDKLDIFRYREVMENAPYIITHQRAATHGLSKEYTQPFDIGDFVFVHNGIMTSYAEPDQHSDSFNFFTAFIEKFNSKSGDREEAIKETLKELLEKIHSGNSFSIALLDKKTNLLYYFKCSWTSINFWISEDKEVLYISTKNDYKDLLPLLGKPKFIDLDIKSGMLYCVSVGDAILVHQISEVKIPKSSSYGHYGGYSSYCSLSNLNDTDWDANFTKSKKKNKPSFKVHKLDGLERCDFCSNPTNLYLKEQDAMVCQECIKEAVKEGYMDKILQMESWK